MTHLVVIVHGMWGTVSNLALLAETLSKLPDVRVLVPDDFTFLGTYAGIEMCGTKVVDAVRAALDDDTTAISFVGYSAGGLFARYAIGVLEAEDDLFSRVRPANFVSLASPHFGVGATPRTRWGRLRSAVMGSTAGLAGGRSATQLSMADEDGVVLALARPSSAFVRGLRRFARVRLYANARADNTVGYCSCALAPRNPYHGADPAAHVPGYDGAIAHVGRVTVAEWLEAAAAARGDSDSGRSGGDAGADGDGNGDGDGAEEVPDTPRHPAHVIPLSGSAALQRQAGEAAKLALRGVGLVLWLPIAAVGLTALRVAAAVSATYTPADLAAARRRLLPPAPVRAVATAASAAASAATTAAVTAKAAVTREGATAGSEGAGERADTEEDAVPDGIDPADHRAVISIWLARSLDIERVDCYLPGFHTHGTIVGRAPWERAKAEQIARHIATELDFSA